MILRLFNDDVSTGEVIFLNEMAHWSWMVRKNLKDNVVPYLKVLFWHSPGETEAKVQTKYLSNKSPKLYNT
jgi:hypothetical protein